MPNPGATQFPVQQSAWDGSDWFTQIWKLTNLQMNVRDFGAKGDGVTDDTAAIQAVINACGAAGGGVVYFPPGIYRLNTAGTSQGALYIKYDNIEIYGPDATLKSTLASQGVFHVMGAYKTAPLTNQVAGWYDYRSFFPINVPTKWADTVTTTVAADAGNFAVGDFVFVRTGEATGTETFQPDAEINQVVAVSPGTGLVTFRWPLLKSYAQEYYAVGASSLTTTTAAVTPGGTSVTVASAAGFAIGDEVTFWGGAGGKFHKCKLTNVVSNTLTFADHPVSAGALIANGASVTNAKGITSTTVTTRLAAFGIAKVTANTIQNLNIHDISFDCNALTANTTAIAGGQLVGMRLERINHIGKGGFTSMGNVRYAWMENNRLHMSTGGQGYMMAFGPGSGEYIVRGNMMTNEDYNQGIVFSEGTDSGIIENNIISGQTTGNNTHNAISVQSRSQGILIRGNRIVNAGGSGIYVDNFCLGGGLIDGNIFDGTFPTAEVSIGSSGWVLGVNKPKGYESALFADIQTPVEQLWCKVKADGVSTSIAVPMGNLPKNVIVTDRIVYTNAAFNGSISNNISIGIAANHGIWAGSSPVGVADTIANPAAVAKYNTTPASPVFAYYVSGGTAPTTGSAWVCLEYRRSSDLNA